MSSNPQSLFGERVRSLLPLVLLRNDCIQAAKLKVIVLFAACDSLEGSLRLVICTTGLQSVSQALWRLTRTSHLAHGDCLLIKPRRSRAGLPYTCQLGSKGQERTRKKLGRRKLAKPNCKVKLSSLQTCLTGHSSKTSDAVSGHHGCSSR